MPLQPLDTVAPVILMADVPGEVAVWVGLGAASVYGGLTLIISRLLTKYFELVETRNRESQLSLEKAEVVDKNDKLQQDIAGIEAELRLTKIQLDESRRGSRGA
jgi:hypothetical protein